MLRSNSKVWGIHVVSPEEEKEGYGGKDLHQQNPTVVNWRCRVLRTLTSIMAVKRWLLL